MGCVSINPGDEGRERRYWWCRWSVSRLVVLLVFALVSVSMSVLVVVVVLVFGGAVEVVVGVLVVLVFRMG